MKKLITFGIASLATVSAVGIASMSASAFGGYGNGIHASAEAGYGAGSGQSLQTRATTLNMTADQLQEQLKTKTMSQIAVDQGLNEDEYRAKMQAAAEARWQEHGLSSEEIAQRTAEREQREATVDHEFGSGEGNHQAGYGHTRS